MPASVSPNPPSQQYWLDREWIHDNYARLVTEHANEWIAVHEWRVLAYGHNLGALEDRARTSCSDPDVVVQFIDDGSLIF